MRVIAGTAGSIRLEIAPGATARPFLEKARGALFNSLGAAVVDARVLDIYAGSGALGIEALSRGAEEAVFLEREKRSVETIQKNLAACKLARQGQIMQGSAEATISRLQGTFDLIFLDPPFPETTDWGKDPTSRTILDATARLLAPEGTLLFRFEHKKATPPDWPPLTLWRDRRYGRSRVCWYLHPTEAELGESNGVG